MNTPRETTILTNARLSSTHQTNTTAAQFWFVPPQQNFFARTSFSERIAATAFFGGLGALAALMYFALAGQWIAALPWIVVLLVGTALAVGLQFYQHRTQNIAGVSEVMATVVEELAGPAQISDREGRLLCANSAYRDHFQGQTPSIRELMTSSHYVEGIRTLMREGKRGQRALYRFEEGVEPIKARAITIAPMGDYLLWCFGEAYNDQSPLGRLGALEESFHHLLDRMLAGLVVVDEGGVVMYATSRALNLLKVSASEIKSRLASELLSNEQLKKHTLELQWLPLKQQARGRERLSLGLLVRSNPANSSSSNLEEFLSYVEHAPLAIVVLDFEALTVQRLNLAAEILLQKFLKATPRIGEDFLKYVPSHRRAEIRTNLQNSHSENLPISPFKFGLRDGMDEVIQVFSNSLFVRNRRLSILYLIDTSEVKRLEMQFVQAQKMQAVGQLAGGVAHDFNNLLTAIIGFCDLLLLRHKTGDQSFADLMQIKQNANRAADLIRQLLAFSRRQALHPRLLKVNEVLSDLSNLIRRLIGEKVKLQIVHGKGVGCIRADQSQIEQVIINLAVNARDAMPDGGTLTISSEFLSKTKIAEQIERDLSQTDHIRIRIEDTGSGVPPEHADKIFEPFFTTKEIGKGTGLGLSTAYGIVTQTGGTLSLVPSQGKGAIFDICLPALSDEEVSRELALQSASQSRAQDLTGSETILFVEDEAPVRTFASRALQSKGYKVVEANSGEHALEILKGHTGPLHVLISDVVMPNMDGPTLALEVMKAHPHIKVILTSGYAEEGFHKSLDPSRFSFIAKPFALETLAVHVREVLDGKRPFASAIKNT